MWVVNEVQHTVICTVKNDIWVRYTDDLMCDLDVQQCLLFSYCNEAMDVYSAPCLESCGCHLIPV